jgi:beta-glucosidase-like glycosyl hydrolase
VTCASVFTYASDAAGVDVLYILTGERAGRGALRPWQAQSVGAILEHSQSTAELKELALKMGMDMVALNAERHETYLGICDLLNFLSDEDVQRVIRLIDDIRRAALSREKYASRKQQTDAPLFEEIKSAYRRGKRAGKFFGDSIMSVPNMLMGKSTHLTPEEEEFLEKILAKFRLATKEEKKGNYIFDSAFQV